MQKIAILYDASQAVLSTFQLDEVLRQILTIVRDYFHLESGAVLLLDNNTQILHVRESFGKYPRSGETAVCNAAGLVSAAARLKRPVYAPDVTKDSRYFKRIESTQSQVAVPLMVRDNVVGVLDCQSDELNHFDPEMVDLLTLFSTQASIAIANADVYSRERKHAAQMEAINAIARQATGVLKLEEMLSQLCSVLEQRLSVQGVTFVLAEPDNSLAVRATLGSLAPIAGLGQPLPPHSTAEAVFSTRGSLLSGDGGLALGVYPAAGTEMLLPLVAVGRCLGVLVLGCAQRHAFSTDDLVPMESVADICATAIQNALHLQQMEQLAYLDGLTGAFNRRVFERRIEEEIDRANRYSTALSVLMVDVDHFKAVNDEFGHLLGDEVLRQISRLFAQVLRKSDVVCRYGGDEFAILLPETVGQSALRAAEKLRQTIAEFEFPGVPRRITISAGISEYPRNGDSRDSLVQAADDCLYAAKQAGRNRVVLIGNVSGRG